MFTPMVVHMSTTLQCRSPASQDFETKLLEAESKRQQQQQRPPPMQQQSPQGQEQQQQQEEQDGEAGEEGQAGGMMEQQMEDLTQEQLEQVGSGWSCQLLHI